MFFSEKWNDPIDPPLKPIAPIKELDPPRFDQAPLEKGCPSCGGNRMVLNIAHSHRTGPDGLYPCLACRR